LNPVVGVKVAVFPLMLQEPEIFGMRVGVALVGDKGALKVTVIGLVPSTLPLLPRPGATAVMYSGLGGAGGVALGLAAVRELLLTLEITWLEAFDDPGAVSA
jgi:hypothetical protein